LAATTSRHDVPEPAGPDIADEEHRSAAGREAALCGQLLSQLDERFSASVSVSAIDPSTSSKAKFS
jgi:hypothetical protein